ncbi:hypothetical protein DEU56DRAFT_181227 [Suillus clintonianus]|uniref:uncharacterized protein n=1 Tax=Suillus clintonianus TaxID=1904413 RepID=UPI001B87D8B8|nr:uncharacterized protein DEU56DRAFT_181227 [Suillus clintonianus]KAG2145764.1 hypothetical protein DEU56DRAFT_181227 [Suillus clintonianus]
MLGSCSSNPSSHNLANSSKTSCKCPYNKKPGKNLVVCIDGTSNTSEHNSHVFELYSNIVNDDEKQTAWYATGVGTYVRPEGFAYVKEVSKILDLVIAHIRTNILNAYEWLSDKYHDGDKIFLFGFSRGAYQVGLITSANKEQIPRAFQSYCAINSGKSTDIDVAKEFKMEFSRSVVMHFIGVWDTVSSVGVNKTMNFPSTATCDHVCYFRQALALDERRVKFLPEYAYGAMSNRSNWFKYQELALPPTDEGRIKEVWFAGSHSDVGGACWKKTSYPHDFRNIPLLWMLKEAHEAGLLVNPRDVAFNYESEPIMEARVTDSLCFWWWVFETLPIVHLSFNSNTLKALPHLGRGRIIMPGQKIHESVLFRPNYRPKAHFWMNVQPWPEAVQWNTASAEEQLSQLDLESLPFEGLTAEILVICVLDKQMLDSLAFMCSFELGVKVVKKANARETLEAIEAILGVDDKRIAGAKRSKDNWGRWPPVDSERNGETNKAREKHDTRLVRFSAFIALCELGMIMMMEYILDDLFQFCFSWIITYVLQRVLLSMQDWIRYSRWNPSWCP